MERHNYQSQIKVNLFFSFQSRPRAALRAESLNFLNYNFGKILRKGILKLIKI